MICDLFNYWKRLVVLVCLSNNFTFELFTVRLARKAKRASDDLGRGKIQRFNRSLTALKIKLRHSQTFSSVYTTRIQQEHQTLVQVTIITENLTSRKLKPSMLTIKISSY